MNHIRLSVATLLLLFAGCATAPKEPAPPPPPAGPLAELARSVQDLQEAVRHDPEDAALHYKLGNALFDLQRFDEAKSEYEATVRLAPAQASAYTNLGLCLKRLGRLPEAVEAYRRALSIDANDTDTIRNLIFALAAQGGLEQAAVECKHLADLKPDDVRVLSQYANVLFSLKRYEEAAQVFEKVLHLDPGLPDDYYNLGLCYYCLERWDAALTSWLAALAHEPRSPAVNKGLAALYWKRGEYKQAWDAVVQCQVMGIPLDPEFIRNLQKDSGQEGPK